MDANLNMHFSNHGQEIPTLNKDGDVQGSANESLQVIATEGSTHKMGK